MTPWNVSGSGRRIFASSVSSSTVSDGSPRRVFDGSALRADDVAEVDVHRPGAVGRAEELDPARAVDEVEEDDLAHVSPAHDAAGQAARRLGLGPRLERLGLGADGGHLDPVGEALGQGRPRWRV